MDRTLIQQSASQPGWAMSVIRPEERAMIVSTSSPDTPTDRGLNLTGPQPDRRISLNRGL